MSFTKSYLIYSVVSSLNSKTSCKNCPTKRAPDAGYAPRFFAFFVALSFLRFEGISTLQPTAANAHRWASICIGLWIFTLIKKIARAPRGFWVLHKRSVFCLFYQIGSGIFGTNVPPSTGHLPLVFQSVILYDNHSLSNETRSLPGPGNPLLNCLA